MLPPRSKSPMVKRLVLVFAALIGVPVAVNLAAVKSERPFGELGNSTEGSPFGQLNVAIGKPASTRLPIRDHFDWQPSDYFEMSFPGLSGFQPPVTKTNDPPPLLLVGCEPLGGATSNLGQLAGICMT